MPTEGCNPGTYGVFARRGSDFRTSSDGIACNFNGSIVNRGCIDRALDAGKHVNLFSPDKRNVKRMLKLYGQHERCTITL